MAWIIIPGALIADALCRHSLPQPSLPVAAHGPTRDGCRDEGSCSLHKACAPLTHGGPIGAQRRASQCSDNTFAAVIKHSRECGRWLPRATTRSCRLARAARPLIRGRRRGVAASRRAVAAPRACAPLPWDCQRWRACRSREGRRRWRIGGAGRVRRPASGSAQVDGAAACAARPGGGDCRR